MAKGRDEPGVDHKLHRVIGDLTVLADGRLALRTADEQVRELGGLGVQINLD
ncbi:MAG TPA: hypothetical protein VG370_08605 [Chloroflexota bacterium]|jgi:hypothetical protein|nr:hypothetical protein [Chloroflexota bacterium]